jgi:hypothetical protein
VTFIGPARARIRDTPVHERYKMGQIDDLVTRSDVQISGDLFKFVQISVPDLRTRFCPAWSVASESRPR